MSLDSYFCFCCLSTDNLTNLSNSFDDIKYNKMLKELFDIKPTQEFNDDSCICVECIAKLKDAYKFKLQVFETINILQVNGLIQLRKLNGELIVTKGPSDEMYVDTKYDIKHEVIEDIIDEEPNKATKLEGINPPKLDLPSLFSRPNKMSSLTDRKTNFESKRRSRKVKKLAKDNKKQIDKENKYIFQENDGESVPDDLKCCICSQVLPNVYVYHTHMNGHFPNHICNICGKGFRSKKKLKRHMLSHDKGPFICQACKAVFTNSSTYYGHMKRKHSLVEQYACPYCAERFRTFTRRARHLVTEHSQAEDKYACPVCRKTFLISANLNKHLKVAHLKIKRHYCRICSASFYHRQDLTSHESVHTGEKLFTCSICFKSYPRKKSLKVHLMTHAKQKPFVCDACGSQFTQKVSLITHMKTHEVKNEIKSPVFKIIKFEIPPKKNELIKIETRENELIEIATRENELIDNPPKKDGLIDTESKDNELFGIVPKENEIEIIETEPTVDELMEIAHKENDFLEIVKNELSKDESIQIEPKEDDLMETAPKEENIIGIEPKDEFVEIATKENKFITVASKKHYYTEMVTPKPSLIMNVVPEASTSLKNKQKFVNFKPKVGKVVKFSDVVNVQSEVEFSPKVMVIDDSDKFNRYKVLY